MSVVDKTLQDENKELKEQIKRYMDLLDTLEKACDSDDDETQYSDESSDESDSEMGECDEESTDDESISKLDSDNLEIKINN